jgi:membrane-associated protein
MEFLASAVDLVLHLDKHLAVLFRTYHVWIYAILFFIIFAETGFVVTPFLPGDSLLFAVGAMIAIDSTGTLKLPLMLLLLIVAAVAGNSVNYLVGRRVGQEAFSGKYRFFKQEYLRQTEAFFKRHGGKAMVLSRYVPIIRTFAPFVAGIGKMNWLRFQAYNFAGGISWVVIMTVAGYLFGNVPIVKNNFGLVTIGIIVVSVLPLVWVFWRDRQVSPHA